MLCSTRPEGATSVKIAGGSKNDDSQAISAWQQGYYIGTLESDVAITSDILRNTGTGAVSEESYSKERQLCSTD